MSTFATLIITAAAVAVVVVTDKNILKEFETKSHHKPITYTFLFPSVFPRAASFTTSFPFDIFVYRTLLLLMICMQESGYKKNFLRHLEQIQCDAIY